MPPHPLYRDIPHLTSVMKPNRKWSHAELKVYVKRWKLDKAPVPLSGSKKTMVQRLKQEGHWDHGGTGRPDPVAKKPKKQKPKFQKEEEVRPTERLEGPAAGSVKARVEGTHKGVLPFEGLPGFGGRPPVAAPGSQEAAKHARQMAAAKKAAQKRRMKAVMKAHGLGAGLGGQAPPRARPKGPTRQMRMGGAKDGMVSHW
jgi:hypothetical protein